jgi:hypothetical protein
MSTLAEKIAVMEAFDRGEAVQSLPYLHLNGAWREEPRPLWNWAYCDYRIKPKPREFYLNRYVDGTWGIGPHENAVSAALEVSRGTTSRYECIHVREVIE